VETISAFAASVLSAVTAPRAFAAIDVGTNSIHLVVARVLDDARFEVIAREKDMVRLGSGGGDMKLLDAAAIDRGVTSLARMKRIADISRAPVRAVATSAVREAENHDEFVRRARDEAGVSVEVVSGVEEARLIHLGILQSLPVFERRLLMCDIGGGSTELLIGQRGEVLTSRSLKLGAVRLTTRFFPGDRLHPGALTACRAFIRTSLSGLARDVATLGFDVAVGSSGTILALAGMARAAAGDTVRTLNAATLTADELASIVKQLVDAPTVASRTKIVGLDAARADIILAGALILEGVFDVFGIDQLTVSDYALREGVLLDTIQRTYGGSLHHLRDLSRSSVAALAELLDEEPTHSAHVARLALALFDATAARHGLDESGREYLEAAALLANVGLFVSHSRHHLHSYYIIRNSDRLTGLTDAEIEVIAQVARYHRKSAPKPSHEAFAALSPEEQHVVRVLAAILRVAIGLDRSHDSRVGEVAVTTERDGLVITARASAGQDLSLECYDADQRKRLLEQVLGLPITIRAA
jgi:exopolyphosphatase/guanosine-5'-triphosphate,3'-diphosphate pyrophosphatase